MKLKTVFWLGFFLLFLGTTLSCRMASHEQSFSAKMDSVDVFINMGDTASALKLLKKSARQAHSALQRLSVYKRYMALGSFDLAEKCLVKGLKRLPESPELRAAYTWFLSGQNRMQEAYEHAKKLEGTNYASILAEFKLNKAMESGSIDFMDSNFASVYADAYVSSKNQAWLQNAALVCVACGDYDGAYSYVPKGTAVQPLFWAYVAYDARRYNASLEQISSVAKTDMDEKTLVLAADCHSVLGEQNVAQEFRSELVSMHNETNNEKVPPQIYINAVMYAHQNGEDLEGYELLKKLVGLYPEYVPGLDMYAKYGLRTLDIPKENALALALRQTDLRSAGMLEYDNLPKVDLNQVEAIISAALESSDNPEIASVLFSFNSNALVAPDLLAEEKIANLWLLLEHYSTQGIYPAEIIELAIPILIRHGQSLEAKVLFDKYLQSRFATDSYDELVLQFSPKECEYAAYFLANGIGGYEDFRLALLLYETIANDKREHYPDLASSPFYKPSVPVLVNLAELYAATRQFKKAKDLYSEAAGFATDTAYKAEVMFRLANLQHETGDNRAAAISLDYCLSIMPSHAKARILQNRISNK